jgi:hypothetical protein
MREGFPKCGAFLVQMRASSVGTSRALSGVTMTLRGIFLAGSLVAALAPATVPAFAGDSVRGARDDRPLAEPAVDDDGDHLVRDGAWSMTVYQLHKAFTAPREAANVNALDEVPDSTWFTNRHGRRRLSPAELARGPNRAHAPAATGPLVVVSAKPQGMTAGFVVRDGKGDRYLLKLDPADYPEVPTGAEMVCTKILYALGWNVPENYLVHVDPARFVVAADADGLDAGDLRELLAHAARGADGRLRAVASRWLPGHAKGGFRTLGIRSDDPDDVVPHEDRRELRGLRVAAAWINYTDARRGNFLDTFVPDPARPGRGRLVHYLLDFSSALGAGNDDWKPPRYGHEYFFDPPHALLRGASFGFVHPKWDEVPLAHPALGYFDADLFDPVAWRTTYPNPLFDAATFRDQFWGAKLVSSLTDADLAVVTRAGEWSDPRAAVVLADLLRRRQRAIARTYFDWRHIDPIDVTGIDAAGRLRIRDLAVENAVVPAASARYRMRVADGVWQPATTTVAVPARARGPLVVDLATSHDGGTRWSPATRVTLATDRRGRRIVGAIERETR